MSIIQVGNKRPNNEEHFSRLLQFCGEVIVICEDLGIVPMLSGSLAVFGYTMNQAMKVNDIDLVCSEFVFPDLMCALDANGVAYQLKDWHVLQVLRDDLKVEFDSMEYWLRDLPDDYNRLEIAGYWFRVVSLSSLKELYRRGLEETASQHDEVERMKYLGIKAKCEALCSVQE